MLPTDVDSALASYGALRRLRLLVRGFAKADASPSGGGPANVARNAGKLYALYARVKDKHGA